MNAIDPDAPAPVATAPATAAQPFEPSKATTALVLAILSWFVCGIFMSIPAVIIARGETAAIKAGRRDPANAGKANTAFWIGIANIVIIPILVIVFFVVGLGGAIVAPTILGQAERARMSRAASEVNEIGKALSRMRTDVGSAALTNADRCLTLENVSKASAPSGCGSGLKSCSPSTYDGGCWGGPYLAATIRNDPWANPYRVRWDRSNNSIRITSAGPDGIPDNSDDITKVF